MSEAESAQNSVEKCGGGGLGGVHAPIRRFERRTHAADLIALYFAAEFVLRWYSQNLAPRFLTEPMSIIRIISFLPFTVLLFQK